MMEMCRRLCYPKQIGSSLASQYIGNVIGAMKMVVRNSGSSYWKKRRQLQEMITEQTLRNALCEVDLKMESKGRKVLLYSIKTGSVLSVYCQINVKLLLARER